MEKKEMILFTKDRMDKVLNSLKIKTAEAESEIIIINPKTNEPAKCEVCEKKITKDSLGHIAHGSTEFYCKNPTCFSYLVVKKELWR